ncbi:MAG: hypothetical protein HQ471_04745 [Flavobacteriales bacterium]|nr:hypothetical protein [Flavobacteriales bacterium]
MRFQNILAFSLAQLVLFSTTTFAVDVHKCSGNIYDISFIGHAKKCDMGFMTSDFKSNSIDAVKSKSCCSDVHFVVNGNTIKKEGDIQLNTFQFSFIVYDNYNKTSKLLLKKKIFHKDYSPPIIIDDFNTSYQVFLI